MPKGVYIRTDKIKKSLSAARKKNWADPNCKYNSEEFREKQHILHLGEKNHNYNRPVSKEIKIKQSKTMKIVWANPKSKYKTKEHIEKIRKIRDDPNSIYKSKEYKQKISAANTGKVHSIEGRKNHSLAVSGEKHPMWGKHHTEESNNRRREYNLHRIIQNKDTKIELAIQNELKNRNINFETNKNIFGRPDVFIEPNICIFCDGDFYHANPDKYDSTHIIWKKRNVLAQDIWKKDWNVTKKLTEENYFVLRFWETDILKDIKSIIDKIETLIY